jgi:hypothetical protein
MGVIKFFGSYKTKMLIEQYEHRDDMTKPYVLVLYPHIDPGCEFQQHCFHLQELAENLKKIGYLLRVVEAGKKSEAAHWLISLHRKYYGNSENRRPESRHKISAAIIGGHGSEDRICFGGKDRAHALTIKDLMSGGLKNAECLFEEKPTIILNSCSTGAEGGIGEKISEALGATVIAPTEPTNIRQIWAEILEGKLHFSVIHRKNCTRIITKGVI